jgi:casein kinase II subunit alpha
MASARDRAGILYSVSKVYADVNETRGPSWYEHKTLNPEYHSPDPYSLTKKVGRGKYSTVFKALKDKQRECAVKILVPLDPRRYLREIKILQNLEDGRNIVRLWDLVRDPATLICSFVFEWVEFSDWRALYNSFDLQDIRLYLYKLLEALDYSHSHGVMHRDNKPQNIAIAKRKKRLRLLDWGLADFYHPKQKYNSHVATRIFKPPELLINYPYYDYSMDIWSTGITFSIMMLRRFALECGEDDGQQLIKVADLVGGKGILQYAQSLGMQLDESAVEALKRAQGTGWDMQFQRASRDLYNPDAVDLLKKLTVIDHRERITAKEALSHPFFASIAQRR